MLEYEKKIVFVKILQSGRQKKTMIPRTIVKIPSARMSLLMPISYIHPMGLIKNDTKRLEIGKTNHFHPDKPPAVTPLKP